MVVQHCYIQNAQPTGTYRIAHETLLGVMCQPGWEGDFGENGQDTCIYMAESLHCSPETITTLLIDYTPIQNKKFKV